MRWQEPTSSVPDAQGPIPDASLLRDLADGALGVHTLCDIHNLTIDQLADLCESEHVQLELSAIRRIAAVREQAIAAQTRVAALDRLVQTATDPSTNPESAHKDDGVFRQ